MLKSTSFHNQKSTVRKVQKKDCEGRFSRALITGRKRQHILKGIWCLETENSTGRAENTVQVKMQEKYSPKAKLTYDSKRTSFD